MRIKGSVLYIKNLVYSSPNKYYLEISDEEYYKNFGLKKVDGNWCVNDKDKLKNAYNRAWNNRDFEINKFWTRAAYFWGFIVLIFGLYFNYSSKENGDKFIQLLIICTGVIFSVAWHFVIRGSKKWQENWEKHIDKLEDFISGPLYKTIFYEKSFYSVSKINEILSVTVIVIWIVLLWHFLGINNYLPWNEGVSNEIDLKIIITIIITFMFTVSIAFGYSRKSYSNNKKVFIKRKPPLDGKAPVQ